MDPIRTEPYFVYILRCSDGTFYTGTAKDVEKRAVVHGSGKGAKYTRSRLPVQVVYTEKCVSKGDALRTECAVKRLSRQEKQNRIEKRERLIRGLSLLYSETEKDTGPIRIVRAVLDGTEIGRIRMLPPSPDTGIPVLTALETDSAWKDTGLEADLFYALCREARERGISTVSVPAPEEAGPEGTFFDRFGVSGKKGTALIRLPEG